MKDLQLYQERIDKINKDIKDLLDDINTENLAEEINLEVNLFNPPKVQIRPPISTPEK